MTIRHYVLLATDGFIDVPIDNNLCSNITEKIYAFGFVGGIFKVDDTIINPSLDWTNPDNWDGLKKLKGTATIPSPIIWGEVDDKIYITLINLGMKERPDLLDQHTVHLHGAHVATQLDGFPETSFGVPMWMDTAPPNITYYFNPMHPGTLMYHCHIEASEHVQMGMYGALIIYPSYASLKKAGITKDPKGNWHYKCTKQIQIPKSATNRNFAYNSIDSYFDKEYIMLLSDIDSTWHKSVLEDKPFNAVNFKPDYWLVNGRAFPDTLLPHPQTQINENDHNLTQINYESYVHIKTDDKLLLRMINMGYQVVPWHIHGWHFTVIGKDSSPSPFLEISQKLGLNFRHLGEGFTATIGSGETFDLLIVADDKREQYRNYIVNGQDGLPPLCHQMHVLQNIDSSSIYDIPTQPVNCPNYDTINYIEVCNQPPYDPNNQFFPQFYPMHNHDDYKVTNNGVYPGGQLTFIQTDAPNKHKSNCLK